MTFVNSSCFNFYQLFLQNFAEKTELIQFLVEPHDISFSKHSTGQYLLCTSTPIANRALPALTDVCIEFRGL